VEEALATLRAATLSAPDADAILCAREQALLAAARATASMPGGANAARRSREAASASLRVAESAAAAAAAAAFEFDAPDAHPRCDAPMLLERGAGGQLTVAWSTCVGVTADCDSYKLEWAPAVAGRAPAWALLTQTDALFHVLQAPSGAHAFRVCAHNAATLQWGPWSRPSPPFEADAAPGSPSNNSPPGELLEGDRQLAAAMLGVRKELLALEGLHPAVRSSQLRRLKAKFHPDKATPEKRALYEELSKHINVATCVKE
jgi:hypothetical protein